MSVKTWTGNEGVREQPANQLWVDMIFRNLIRQSVVTVGLTATLIPSVPLSKRRTLMIMNNSSNVVYIGNSSVTTSDGFPLYPRSVLNISIEDTIDIYGISTGSSECRVFEGS